MGASARLAGALTSLVRAKTKQFTPIAKQAGGLTKLVKAITNIGFAVAEEDLAANNWDTIGLCLVLGLTVYPGLYEKKDRTVLRLVMLLNNVEAAATD